MKPIAIETHRSPFNFEITAMPRVFVNTEKWISTREANWRADRLTIADKAVTIQVTFAALLIALSGAAGVSPLIYTIGIFFSFLADGLAFAKAPRDLVLAGLITSILVNFSLGIYFFLHVVH